MAKYSYEDWLKTEQGKSLTLESFKESVGSVPTGIDVSNDFEAARQEIGRAHV